MAHEWIGPLVGLGLTAIGMAVAPVAAPARSRGWLGIVLASAAAFFWFAAPRTGVFGLFLICGFLLVAPVTVVYAFRCETRAPDRAAAGVAFISSFILGALLLVTVAGLVQSLWITRPGSPNHTMQRMGASRSARSESLSQWRLAPTLMVIVPRNRTRMFKALKTLFSKRPPPSPDTSALVPVHGQQIVEEFFSEEGTQRVSILRDERGIFRVRSFRWCIEDWEVAGRAFWIQEDAMNTMTDTLEDARRLAGEYLAGLK